MRYTLTQVLDLIQRFEIVSKLVESPFASLRLGTDSTMQYKGVDRAIAMIGEMLMAVEQRFRCVRTLGLMQPVCNVEKCGNRVTVQTTNGIAPVVDRLLDVTSPPQLF